MSVRGGQRGERAYVGLVAVQVVQLLGGLVTGPLLARTLGPDGRGLLAAVQTPIGLAPLLGQLGLGAYAVRETARGVPPREVFGSLMVPLLAVGLLGAITAPLVVSTLAEGKNVIQPYLEVGLMLLPVAFASSLLTDIMWGLERWRVVIACRLAPPLVTLLGFVGLAIAGSLDVKNASVVTLIAAFATVTVLVPAARSVGRPSVRRSIIRGGMRFGLRAWPGTVASLANLRLDQFLMIPLVPARELGLYAVAVTVSGLGAVASSQVMTIAFPRIAATGGETFTRAIRVSLLIALLGQVVICVATFVVFVPLFGREFTDATALVYVLAIGGVFQIGVSAIGQGLAALGRPLAPTVGEFVALGITVPGLLVLLDPLGAMGAAIVSDCAYAASFGVQLAIALRRVEPQLRRYLPGASDVRLLIGAARSALRGFAIK